MVTHFIKFVFFKAKVKAKVQMEEMKGVKKKKVSQNSGSFASTCTQNKTMYSRLLGMEFSIIVIVSFL